MAHIRKGQLTATKEWRVHLRPYWKRRFWSMERGAEKTDIERQMDDALQDYMESVKNYTAPTPAPPTETKGS